MWPYAAWTRASFWNTDLFMMPFCWVCWGLGFLLTLGGVLCVLFGVLRSYCLLCFVGVFFFLNLNWMLPKVHELIWPKFEALLYIIQNQLWKRKRVTKKNPKPNKKPLWSPKCAKHEVMMSPLIQECKLKLQNVLLSNHTLN